MKIKIIAIFSLFLFSCSSNSKLDRQTKNTLHKIESFVYNSNINDSLYLDLYVILNNKNFVFKKSNNIFEAEIDISINITDVKSEKQVLHESWSESLIEEFYNKTRSHNNKKIIYKNFLLPSGEYKFFVFIEDKDSKNNWVIKKKISIDSINGISDIIVKEKTDYQYKFLLNNEITNQDSIYCFFQLDLSKTFDRDNFAININNKIVSNYKISKESSLDNYFCLRLPVKAIDTNDPSIEFVFYDSKKSVEIKYDLKKIESILSDPDLFLEVMFYYGFIDSYKDIKNQTKDFKYNYIKNYFLKLDPDLSTEQNELLVEFNSRIEYAINKFSTLGPGWRSDRGKILINYGYPIQKENSQNNDNGYSYIVWYYPSGKKVVFIDQDGFGDYKIYREM